MTLIRLQKYLSAAGVCSRRHGENHIRQGHVSVNGAVVTQFGTKIDPAIDRVTFKGCRVVVQDKLIYIALNKPEGIITSCSHPGEKTILDIVDIPQRIYPIGRLDKNSTGLLLLTNNGHIHHRLLHPSFDHEKEYDVKVEKPISPEVQHRLENGMPIMGITTRPATIKKISDRRFRIVLKEGRNKQIRRMVRKVGNRVRQLKRIRFAGIRLGNLAEGSWRYLTEREIKRLLASIKPAANIPSRHG